MDLPALAGAFAAACTTPGAGHARAHGALRRRARPGAPGRAPAPVLDGARRVRIRRDAGEGVRRGLRRGVRRVASPSRRASEDVRPAPVRGPRPVPGPEGRRGGAGAPLASPGARAASRATSPVPVAASDEERLRSKRFEALEPGELAQLYRLMARLRVATPLRRTRRAERGRRGEHLDLRRTLRGSLRTGGDPIRLARRRRRVVRRRLVLLCDISGSMEPYARAYLQFLTSAAGSGPNAEAFVFATRLTRLTRALASRSPQRAIQRAAAAAPDWSSGTRIGEALSAFNDRHGRRGMARGAVMVILSDGWERGDPALRPRDGAARPARPPDRVGEPARERRAASRPGRRHGGGAAHCDALVSGHSLAALDEVADAIGAPRHRRSLRGVPEPRTRRSRGRARRRCPAARWRCRAATARAAAAPRRVGDRWGRRMTDRRPASTRLRPARGAAAPAGRAAAGVLRPRGAQRADGAPGAPAPRARRTVRTRRERWLTRRTEQCSCASIRPARWCSASPPSPTARRDAYAGSSARSWASRRSTSRSSPPTPTASAPATASTRARRRARRRRSSRPPEDPRQGAAAGRRRLGTDPDALRWDNGAFVGDVGLADDRRRRAVFARLRRAAAGSRGRPGRADGLPRLMATLGPGDGTLTVRTGRSGAAAKAGHDLVLEVTSWRRRSTSRRSCSPPTRAR